MKHSDIMVGIRKELERIARQFFQRFLESIENGWKRAGPLERRKGRERVLSFLSLAVSRERVDRTGIIGGSLSLRVRRFFIRLSRVFRGV